MSNTSKESALATTQMSIWIAEKVSFEDDLIDFRAKNNNKIPYEMYGYKQVTRAAGYKL